MSNRRSVQHLLASVVVLFGLVLLTASFLAPPLGEISPSVLTAVGEVFCPEKGLLVN